MRLREIILTFLGVVSIFVIAAAPSLPISSSSFTSSPVSLSSSLLPSDLVAVGTATDPVSGLPLEVRTRKNGLLLRLVPGGSFTMGSNQGDHDEKNLHPVNVSAFYMGKYALSNVEYEKFQLEHRQGRGKYASGDHHPSTRVSWGDAQAYLGWLSREEGVEGGTYRLPTEAEREKAARGSLVSSKYPWGTVLYAAFNIYSERSAVEVSAGQPHHTWGLYHMSGNILEWCQDWYGVSYSKVGQVNPQGPSEGRERVLRGGTWYLYERSLRVADRWKLPAETISDHVGFRVVRSVGVDRPHLFESLGMLA